jgi:hypothetical protein
MDIILFCRQILRFTAYLNSFVKKISLARVKQFFLNLFGSFSRIGEKRVFCTIQYIIILSIVIRIH